MKQSSSTEPDSAYDHLIVIGIDLHIWIFECLCFLNSKRSVLCFTFVDLSLGFMSNSIEEFFRCLFRSFR